MISPLAGALLTLSFAPFDYVYGAFFSLIFAVFTWQGIPARRAFLRGFLYGLGLFGLGVSWVYISIHDFGGAHFIGAVLLTALFVMFWALFPALTAFCFARFICFRHPILRAVFVSSIWLLIEYFRGFLLLNGFPWLQIAYSQLDTALAGYIPVIGVYGCGFLLIFSAAVLAEQIKNKKYVLQSAVILLLIWGGGMYLKKIDWTSPVGDSIQVTLIQGNVSQDQKWLPQNRINTMLNYQAMTKRHWDSDVIIWPETAIPAFRDQVQDFFLTPLNQDAIDHHSDLIVSMPARDLQTNEHFNMVLTLGKNPGEYKKNHLLPFGEYLPLQPVSGFVLDILKIHLGNFSAGGDNQPLMKAGGYPFVTSICYEDAFSSVFIPFLPKAAYFVNVTNDAWFGHSIEPYQHLQIARMRALEAGRYLLRATNTGVTAVIDSKGGVIKEAPLFVRTSITQSIVPMGGLTPYAWLGEQTVVIVILVVFILLAISGLRQKSE